ncbi:MAG: NADPH:quinone reductase [Arthrobacter sp.]|uniref:NADPH2:quinone reductase n=1 Tax=Pseudarthrobacter oxydans TaxID=1671 RepID=A0AAW8N8C5_PSEOX|nr:quinone oxidoreductase [Pseudarthrobacter oxydans]MBA4100772.1 NADPH:quinone reductase [Arthrobacter sp.]MDR6791304.1 NADPH2:quinone reductase [Pseudarthrobacter oxydans]MDR7163046.1 NADPH2:quinone reductase [Pseudarthrobacter oxydans]BFE46537.1 quinone oxidoreductase [Pseudarthrobacter oxydans]
MTHAIVARQAGGPEVLTYEDVERPVPGPGQLLVKVGAAGVNFIDTYKRSGTYKVPFPFTPGSEAAGTVEAVGDGVTGFVPGDRVATAEGINCYADYALVDEGAALPVPRGLDDLTAAALPLQGITAHYLMNSTFKVEPGHTVLLHAGAGGVGLLLIQLLKARGAEVITTVSTDAKEQLARGAGADHVLRYEGFAERVREITSGTGADVVYDGVGKDTFDGSLAALRVRGMLVLFGAASGPVPPVDPQRLNAGGSLFLTRPTLGHYLRDAAERRWRSGEVFAAAANGSLKVRIGARYPLVQAAQAHRDLEGRKTTGKVILVP